MLYLKWVREPPFLIYHLRTVLPYHNQPNCKYFRKFHNELKYVFSPLNSVKVSYETATEY